MYSRSAVMINPIDLASNEDTDLAVLPSFLVGQQVRDEQGQACQKTPPEILKNQPFSPFYVRPRNTALDTLSTIWNIN